MPYPTNPYLSNPVNPHPPVAGGSQLVATDGARPPDAPHAGAAALGAAVRGSDTLVASYGRAVAIKSGQKKVVRKRPVNKGGQKTVDRILELLHVHPVLTQQGLVRELGINRSAIQRHLSNLKNAGKIRRVGPDKGGHWEVIE